MSQSVRIKLSGPVQRFLGEYITEGSLSIRHNTPMGKFILACVDVCDVPPKGRPVEQEVVLVKIPDQLKSGLDGRSSCLYVSEAKQQLINELFEFIMEKELYDRLMLIEERGEVRQRNGKQAAEIRAFIQKYSADSDDLSYETLKKRYQRYKERSASLMDKVFDKSL